MPRKYDRDMMKYLQSIPVLMLISVLFPIAYFVQWLANVLMTATINLVEYLPKLDE